MWRCSSLILAVACARLVSLVLHASRRVPSRCLQAQTLGIVAGMDKKDFHVVTLILTCLMCAMTGAVKVTVQKTADFQQLQLIS